MRTYLNLLFLGISVVLISCNDSNFNPVSTLGVKSKELSKALDVEPSEITIANLYSQETYEYGSHTITDEEFIVNGAGATTWPFYLYTSTNNIESDLEFYRIRVKRNGIVVKTVYRTGDGVKTYYFNISDIHIATEISLEITPIGGLFKTNIQNPISTCHAWLRTNFGY